VLEKCLVFVIPSEGRDPQLPEIAGRDADPSSLGLLGMTTKFFNKVAGKKKAAIHSRLVWGRDVRRADLNRFMRLLSARDSEPP
jgi:hypothetical protein